MDAIRDIFLHEYGVAPLRVGREHGGCMNECFRVDLPDNKGPLFVKANDDIEMFHREAVGLRALAATNTFRVPQVFHVGSLGNAAYLIMEFVSLTSSSSGGISALTSEQAAALGTALGELHTYQPPSGDDGDRRFGFDVDNFLGITAQQNTPRSNDWVAFFKDTRLQFQLNLLQERGDCTDQKFLTRVQQLIDRVGDFFDQDERKELRASLLHGDLWAGNWGFTTIATDTNSAEVAVVVFDPACYWGHSEADLAMMTLFGRPLPKAFYDSYFAIVPKASRFETRVPLYQLYHALNHYNLFGASYQGLCEELLKQLETTTTDDNV